MANNNNGNEYLYDKFIDEPDKTPQEQHKENMRKFLSQYTNNLKSTISKFDDDFQENFGNAVGDPLNDPIKFKFEPSDVQRFDELFQTDNKVLAKIVLVVAHLCWEMQTLKEIAHKKFYPAIAVFGDSPVQKNSTGDGNQQQQAPTASAEDGDKQLQFGRALSLLMLR